MALRMILLGLLALLLQTASAATNSTKPAVTPIKATTANATAAAKMSNLTRLTLARSSSPVNSTKTTRLTPARSVAPANATYNATANATGNATGAKAANLTTRALPPYITALPPYVYGRRLMSFRWLLAPTPKPAPKPSTNMRPLPEKTNATATTKMPPLKKSATPANSTTQANSTTLKPKAVNVTAPVAPTNVTKKTNATTRKAGIGKFEFLEPGIGH